MTSPVKITLTVTVQINAKYISLVVWLKLLYQNFLIYPLFFWYYGHPFAAPLVLKEWEWGWGELSGS